MFSSLLHFSTTIIVKHIFYLRFRLHKHWHWWQKSQKIRAQFLNDFETSKVVWIEAIPTFSFTNFFMAFTTPAILLKNLLLSDGKQWNLISPLNFVRCHPRRSFFAACSVRHRNFSSFSAQRVIWQMLSTSFTRFAELFETIPLLTAAGHGQRKNWGGDYFN